MDTGLGILFYTHIRNIDFYIVKVFVLYNTTNFRLEEQVVRHFMKSIMSRIMGESCDPICEKVDHSWFKQGSEPLSLNLFEFFDRNKRKHLSAFVCHLSSRTTLVSLNIPATPHWNETSQYKQLFEHLDFNITFCTYIFNTSI